LKRQESNETKLTKFETNKIFKPNKYHYY